MICPNCNNYNDNNNNKCSLCGIDLTGNFTAVKSPVNEQVETESNEFMGIPKKPIKTVSLITNILIVIPFLLAGIAFFCVGLYFTISENSKINGYSKTIAYLKGTTNCESGYGEDGSDTYCEAIYEYEVDGKKYTVSPADISPPSDFDKEKEVYYNPDKPEESIILASWKFLIVAGIVAIGISIITIFIRQAIIKSIINSNFTVNQN